MSTSIKIKVRQIQKKINTLGHFSQEYTTKQECVISYIMI